MKAEAYKIKCEMCIIPCNDGIACTYDVLYVCDPEINTACKKTNCKKIGCGDCEMTTNVRFAKRFDLDE